MFIWDSPLDLLDNCVDGILRTEKRSRAVRPYTGFRAEIGFDKRSFSIDDNCGGIPWDLHDYAFRMGRANKRPSDPPGTVGVYGIGMKRAIFKMGRRCSISTQHKNRSYEVKITPTWMDDQDDWRMPVNETKSRASSAGTKILISQLHPGIKARFSDNAQAFTAALEKIVATHYAFIIEKGFEVKINGRRVKPQPTRLIFDKEPGGRDRPSIKPFIFKAEHEGVEVFLAVGFTRPIPSQDEMDDEEVERKHSTLDAGWTIVCNDRAVVYCNRDELTGWGEAGVPRYHTQFIAISGVVEFRSRDASKLPTTTTKRNIDASSTLYLQIKNKMRQGMQLFTDYTYKWKGRAEESKKYTERGVALSLPEIKKEAQKLKLTATTRMPQGKQFLPPLPQPKKQGATQRRICFSRDVDQVEVIRDYLFDDRRATPSDVGEKCFDLILKDALK